MPYYVFDIRSPRRLAFVEAFEAYRDAKTFARERRRSLAPEDDCTVRMIFAPSKEQAERLLKEPREARPLGEDA